MRIPVGGQEVRQTFLNVSNTDKVVIFCEFNKVHSAFSRPYCKPTFQGEKKT